VKNSKVFMQGSNKPDALIRTISVSGYKCYGSKRLPVQKLLSYKKARPRTGYGVIIAKKM